VGQHPGQTLAHSSTAILPQAGLLPGQKGPIPNCLIRKDVLDLLKLTLS